MLKANVVLDALYKSILSFFNFITRKTSAPVLAVKSVEDKEGTVKCSTNTLVLFAWIGESAWILPPKP